MSSPARAAEFLWLTTWVEQRLGACLTFGRGLPWQRMLEGFGMSVSDRPASQPGDPHLDSPKIHVGSNGEWGWAIEHFTVEGSKSDTLCRLSSGGAEALSLTFTQTLSTFFYASDGSIVNGFVLTLPQRRFGSDPDRFDAAMARAGYFDPNADHVPAEAAFFLELAFGLKITEEMLRNVAHTADLPATLLPPTRLPRGGRHPGPRSAGRGVSKSRVVAITRPRPPGSGT